jgi:hypothetical protein
MKFDFFTIFFDFFWSSNGKRWVDDVTLIRHDKSIKEHLSNGSPGDTDR